MSGRNFWAVCRDGQWQVREEGLPDATTDHAGEAEAWRVANERARDAHGDAFLDDGDGGVLERKSYRQLPDTMRP